jgi:hypothetical protein
MSQSNGAAEVGDLNATYNEMYYKIQPGYSLIILGTFPNTRFMSATVYDDHSVVVGQLADTQILPLSATMVNPLLPGATYVANQQYGITVNLGNGPPLTVAPGCSTTMNTTIDENVLDGSMIHSGITWKGYPGLPPGFPPHETGVNEAGILEVRKYMDISVPTTASVIVRQLSDGCAVPAAQALNVILAPTQPNPSPWMHEGQMQNHSTFAKTIQPQMCFPQDPLNHVTWLRTPEYVPIANGENASIQANFAQGYIPALVAGKGFLRVQFQLPTHPTTPCVGGVCSFTGDEQQRYKSLSLQNSKNTLISLKDTDFVTDPNGNVTLIVSLGAVPPPQVTAANYYTYVDLTTNPNYASLQSLFIRDIIPNSNFLCSSWNVPFKTMSYFPMADGTSGGFMGPYNMTVDFPTASEIPTTPIPPVRPNTCAVPPPTPPYICPV